ncbi:MAG: benenodin family lasso peptide [Sphingomonas sp.]|nr:benenodin family lasso peptide [Sphingomonas sp.]MBO9623960.1 benenodin family lasso peptide [Sphingomonas sp.]
MEREDDVIELGAASVETKGPGGPTDDVGLGIFPLGLSDD